MWWLLRPVSVIGPLLATLPVIYLFGRRWESQTTGPPPRIVPIEDDEVGDGGDAPLPDRAARDRHPKIKPPR